MARNVAYAYVLLMGTMLKLSIKLNIPTCLVPCDRFLIGLVSQFHCLQECWRPLKILSVKSLGLLVS